MCITKVDKSRKHASAQEVMLVVTAHMSWEAISLLSCPSTNFNIQGSNSPLSWMSSLFPSIRQPVISNDLGVNNPAGIA